jgi:LCP family protein required for cell wall assembly
LAFAGGYLLGLVGGALVLVTLLVLSLVVFPPQRTNILLLGLDRRPDEDHFVVRTDTMILATVNPPGGYVGMLSIPRDLFVTLPDGSLGRINTAHFFAEAGEPGSGPAAAANTVRSNFGVDVHRYVRLDLVGFVRVVDALGGVWIDVPTPLIDYEYPTYDYGTRVVEFEAGEQRMDGEQALAYARIRHGSSDFARAERQQLVIQAIFRRLLSPAAWVRLPLVAAAVTESLDTNLGLVDLARLAPTLLRAGPDRLDRRVIQGSMVEAFTTDGGASVQLPVWEAINPVLLELFGQ